MMCDAVQQHCGHFGSAKNGGPFAKGEIGRNEYRGALIKPADQVEEKLSARFGKGQVAEFVADHEVQARQMVGSFPRERRGLVSLDLKLGELRRALLQEGGHALLEIVAREALLDPARGFDHGFAELATHVSPNLLFHHHQSVRC